MLLAAPPAAAAAAAEGGDHAGLRPWRDYRTILWVGDSAWKEPAKTPVFFERLREMGINTGMVYGEGSLEPFVEQRFPYYVENIINRGLCLKWNAKVRDWDRFITDWSRNGRPEAALVREYCLDDPAWQSWSRGEMRRVARKNQPHAPLAYDIRDELSTTLSANPFDYDFHPLALSGFRAWLQTQYANLAALNRQWETQFKTWDEVRPFTTDQIKARMASGEAQPKGKPDWQALQRVKFDPRTACESPTRWNFAPWADFRTYMDLSLARTLDDLRQAAREVDPETPVGIEGTQMPHAFGGYDLWRLSQAIDWVEPYDLGNAREIFGSFMPGRPILTTVFEKETLPARRRLWHLLLEGDRGCIVWWSEDCIDWKSDDLRLTPKALALAPVLTEMTSGLARLFMRAQRVRDPIYIHYSQPSIQVDWLLESTVDGSTWVRRFSSYEADHNHLARIRNGWLKLFQDLGYAPQFLSSAQIEAGALRKTRSAILVLPNSLALSDSEADEIRSFVGSTDDPAAARALVGGGTPGCFDQHGTLRPKPALAQMAAALSGAEAGTKAFVMRAGKRPQTREGDVAQYAAERLKPAPDPGWADWLGHQLSFLPPGIQVDASHRVRVHRFEVSRGQLVAFERNLNYHISEDLKQAGGNEALEHAVEVEARLARPMHAYDLRAQKSLGRIDRLRFTLSPWEPALFALTAEALPAGGLLEALARE
jgi:hypothetical protein